MGRRVAVVGTAQTKAMTKKRGVSIPDLTFEVVAEALHDSGLRIHDIDAVVFGMAPETFDGVNCPDKWCADAAGALNKPFMRINTGGATGLSSALAAIDHISSGMFDVVIAVAEQRIKQTADAQRVLNATYDPLYAQDIRINIATSIAAELLICMKKYGFTEYHNAKIAVKNHMNALNNPFAHIQKKVTIEDALKSRIISWPLRLLDICPSSEAGCAIIFASEDKARKICLKPAWVRGFADTTGTPNIGGMEGEDHTQNWSLAAHKAYKMAGITNPRKEIQVAETYHPVGPFEIPEYAAFGFCESHEVVKLVEMGFGEMTGEIPWCPSGGVVCSNPIAATGLIRVAEAAMQVMGKGGARQVPDVKNAICSAGGGSPGSGVHMFMNLMILGTEPR